MENIKIPTNCPRCDYLLEMSGENLMCLNTTQCPAQVLGKVLNWVSGLNLLEWGDTLVQKLVDLNLVKDSSDLYTLSIEDLLSIDRMGNKSSEKCLKILNENKEISLETFLGSLSIHLINKSTIKLLMSNGFNTLQDFQNATIQQFSSVVGMGEVKSEKLFNGLLANKLLIEKLLLNGITIKYKTEGKLTGKSFCFSGKFSIKRDELEKIVLNLGGEVKSSIQKQLTYLVLEDKNSTSSKAVAARKNNTTIISEQDFNNLIK